MPYYATSLDHLLAEVERIDLLLRVQVWQAQQLQGALMYLASASERSEDGGEPVDRYKIVVTPTGDVQVNGQPVF